MSEKIKKRKIMLVGTGFVGMSFAYSMLSEKGIDGFLAVENKINSELQLILTLLS